MNAVYETFHFFSSLTHHHHGYFLKAPEIAELPMVKAGQPNIVI
jgi:hypothetical protein